MSNILVVGSLAYDSIATPTGKVSRTLGGSANYFSVAASNFAKVRVVGVVGEDYDKEDFELLAKRGVDTRGLTKTAGKTFHWSGSYEKDLNEAQTLATELNVFEHFNPELPAEYRDSQFVFLANIDPELQLKVLSQIEKPILVGSDTMNLWIDIKRPKLLEVLKKVDVLLINEGEAKMLTEEPNAIAACVKLRELGPKRVVVKRGEYGFVMLSEHGYFMLPAAPIAKVVDPTGAGDTFAGGFFGYLAQLGRTPTEQEFRKACVVGTITASYTIEGFGLSRLREVTPAAIESRKESFLSSTIL